VIGPREALHRLRFAAESGDLALVCERFDVALLVAFGSAARDEALPRDLDLAARFTVDVPDVLGLLDALSVLAGISEIDLMNLNNAGPVARERALVPGHVLYQREPGSFATAQISAMMERMDTNWLRRLDLGTMAG
jgi:predicted nucleotidyltransferase